MPVIELHNHNEILSLTEIAKLFFASLEADESKIFAGEDDNLIISGLAEAICGTAQQDNLHAHDTKARFVEVTTTCTGFEKITAQVIPEQARRELKRQLYCQLERLTETAYPWGSLTGVRPTQIAVEEYEAFSGDPDMVKQRLTDHWRLSEEKSDLAIETALEEERLIRTVPEASLFVYLGVPFCPSRCSYCSFISRDAKRQKQHLGGYVDAMIMEIREVFGRLDRKVSGMYLGGGTPTSLSDYDFARLMEAISTYIPVSDNVEWTVEAGRPDTITGSKLQLIRQGGVTRICINPQTMHDDTLIRIGRNHSVNQTLEAFHLARDYGFSHINMDLIAGLPGESPADLLDSVNRLMKLRPESVTLHSLAIKRSSHLQQNADHNKHDLLRPDADLAQAVYEAGRVMRSFSYRPYYLYRQKEVIGGLENTGFALPGKACLYNVAMMSDRFDVIGIGSGAMSKKTGGTRTKRQPNSKDLIDYQKRLPELIERKIRLFSQ